MVLNNAGGYVFGLTDWDRLDRFLILGSEGGTFYVRENDLMIQNTRSIINCIQEDGVRVVQRARDINVRSLSPKVNPQLFTMALALCKGCPATRAEVERALPYLLRTGTHFLNFVAMMDSMGGWNRTKRRIVKNWLSQDIDRLGFQMVKYANRDGWSMRDVLRICHLQPPTPEHNTLFAWVTGKDMAERVQDLPAVVREYLRVRANPTAEEAVTGLQRGLPREALPTELLNDPKVALELLKRMPTGAVIRNLGQMTANGVLRNDTVDLIRPRFERDALVYARMHPFAVMLAMLTYAAGRGIRSSKQWVPLRPVIELLEQAYEDAYEGVTPTQKRILVAIDVSGSMGMAVSDSAVPCSYAASALALTLARCEPNADVVTFAQQVQQKLAITKRSSLANWTIPFTGGGTNIASPIEWATGSKSYDAFIILTDNETWAGNQHVTQAMQRYRSRHGRSKLIIAAMAANHATVVDPSDPDALGFVGLDASLPTLVTGFLMR